MLFFCIVLYLREFFFCLVVFVEYGVVFEFGVGKVCDRFLCNSKLRL